MSIEALNAVWKYSKSKGARRLVMLALADYANDHNICWPSLETLAKKCNMSRRYVIDCLSDLEEMGEIRKETNVENGLYTSNYYTILVVNYSSPLSKGGSEQECTTSGEQEFTRVVNQSSPKPSLNHHNESSIEEEESPEFCAMRDMLSQMTGLSPTHADIPSIEECVRVGVVREDIEGALQWRKDNHRGPVKVINQLVQGIMTNRSIRIQGDNAKPHRKRQESRYLTDETLREQIEKYGLEH